MGGKILLIFIIFLFAVCWNAYAESALSNLIELARNQAQIQKAYERETSIYESVKKAVEKGKLIKGQNRKDVEKCYGEPVIILQERGTTREKWYYKKASSSFFGGERLVLFFDKSGILEEIFTENKK